MNLSPSHLCQIELPVSNMERAGAFYHKALGWAPMPAEIYGYMVLDVPATCSFGIALVQAGAQQASDESPRKPSTTLYFRCESPEDVLAAIGANGGKVFGTEQTLAGYGTLFRFDDPDGNRFGIFSRSQQGLDPSQAIGRL
jgi:predicted enzyme related to lactoylglutathione lyase